MSSQHQLKVLAIISMKVGSPDDPPVNRGQYCSHMGDMHPIIASASRPETIGMVKFLLMSAMSVVEKLNGFSFVFPIALH